MQVVPETFVRQLIGTQRMLYRYQKFNLMFSSWAFYRWLDRCMAAAWPLHGVWGVILGVWLQRGQDEGTRACSLAAVAQDGPREQEVRRDAANEVLSGHDAGAASIRAMSPMLLLYTAAPLLLLYTAAPLLLLYTAAPLLLKSAHTVQSAVHPLLRGQDQEFAAPWWCWLR